MRGARRLGLVAATIVFAAFLSGCDGDNAQKSKIVTVHEAVSPPAARAPAARQALAFENRLVQVVKAVGPSVVQIETGGGLGSGVVYDSNGDIVTNAHVVGDATRFTVTLANGSRHSGTLVGTFPPNDVAVIHVDGARPRAALFGPSRRLDVGDVVLAIGNPLGLRSSVTEGIISSLGRTVSEGNGVTLPSVIQTSAAINPGNSGGALVNLNSEVVGIPTLAAIDPEFGQTPAAGIGFAIPSDSVRVIADQLIKTGKVTRSGRAYLGVRVATLIGGGVVVAQVERNGPAASAGMKVGDLIVSVNNKSVVTTDDLATVLADVKPGTTIPVVVNRNGKRLTLDVKVAQLTSAG
jgi:putative serine protease PepD